MNHLIVRKWNPTGKLADWKLTSGLVFETDFCRILLTIQAFEILQYFWVSLGLNWIKLTICKLRSQLGFLLGLVSTGQLPFKSFHKSVKSWPSRFQTFRCIPEITWIFVYSKKACLGAYDITYVINYGI